MYARYFHPLTSLCLESGRKALMDADGIRILYNTCQETIECRELEGIIFVASIIMRKCFPKNRLPLHSLRSSLSCQLPESDFHVLESVIIPTGSGRSRSKSAPGLKVILIVWKFKKRSLSVILHVSYEIALKSCSKDNYYLEIFFFR